MKSSLKFRENQKPLFKTKIPLNILGLPFQSTLAAGYSKELCLSLATFFDSGPAFRVSYRPNDAFNPLSLVIKSGIGHFGSPIDAPFTMSAEFNFSPGNSNSTPSFFLHFKPRFGDFLLKKTHKSNRNVGVSEEDGSIEVVEKPSVMDFSGEYFTKDRITSLPLKSSVEDMISGVELGAKTALPIRNCAVLKLGWGMKFPEGFQSLFTRESNSRVGMRFSGLPYLVLNKIGIEQQVKEDKKKSKGGEVGLKGGDAGGGSGGGSGGNVMEEWLSVKRQLEAVQAENAVMGRVMEDLKGELSGKVGRGRELDGVLGGDHITNV